MTLSLYLFLVLMGAIVFGCAFLVIAVALVGTKRPMPPRAHCRKSQRRESIPAAAKGRRGRLGYTTAHGAAPVSGGKHRGFNNFGGTATDRQAATDFYDRINNTTL